jgi:translation initiation factor IF-2
VREQLYRQGVEVEGFRQGSTTGVPCVEISAKTGRGMEDLKAAIIVQAEIMDLRAPTDGDAEVCSIVRGFLRRIFIFVIIYIIYLLLYT